MRPAVFCRIAGPLREPHPQHVDRRAESHDLQAGALAHDRVPSVGPDHEIGPHLEPSPRRLAAHAGNAPAVLDQLGHLGLHGEVKARIMAALPGQEVEKIPLRHHRNKMAVRRQMTKIGERDLGVADDAVQFADFLVRQREKRVEQAKLVHDLQGRGVDRVAAEIAQKIAVLLEDDHLDPGAGQQEAQHHSGRTAAGDRTGGSGRRGVGHRLASPPTLRHAAKAGRAALRRPALR